MATYKSSRTLPTILTVIVIIIAIAGLVAIARFVFFPGSSSSPVTDTSRDQLLSSAVDRSVSMTVRGPIVADENFRSYQITVSPTSRTIKTYSGYLDAVLDQRTLPNNTAAYEEFVHALDKANFVAGQPFTGDDNDVRGICATGRVYEFSLLSDSEISEMLWTSTCSGSKGSLRASAEQLSQLFRAQIPESRDLIRDVSL
jgi:hypothetical protein